MTEEQSDGDCFAPRESGFGECRGRFGGIR
jgi:hypothetical protein